jgi:hypothetical protein
VRSDEVSADRELAAAIEGPSSLHQVRAEQKAGILLPCTTETSCEIFSE